jgi:peroxiredoxin
VSSTTPQTIAESVAELNAAPSPLPAEVRATFADEAARLAATPVPAGVAVAGTPLPDGPLLDVHGAATTLAQVRAGRPAVVVFYRGAWCPYCNIALRAYQQQLEPALAEQGVALIAISPQAADGSLSMQEKHDLSFDVLSDPGNGIAGALGILTAPGDAVRAAQLGLGLDIAAGNADGTTTLPMPTTLVVDAGGTIRWIDVHPDHTTRSEPGEILAAVAAAR